MYPALCTPYICYLFITLYTRLIIYPKNPFCDRRPDIWTTPLRVRSKRWPASFNQRPAEFPPCPVHIIGLGRSPNAVVCVLIFWLDAWWMPFVASRCLSTSFPYFWKSLIKSLPKLILGFSAQTPFPHPSSRPIYLTLLWRVSGETYGHINPVVATLTNY